MKKTILTILGVAAMFITNAQTVENQPKNEGLVNYEEVIKFDIKLDSMPSEIQAMMPKEQRLKKVLYFNNEISVYKKSGQNEESGMVQESENSSMKIYISEPDEIVCKDFKNNKKIEQKDFMNRMFLVESDLNKMEWKLSGKQKIILGYPCQEATRQDSTKKITAWFTPVISISTGPSEFGNLPGLILEVNINNGDINIIAKSIELKKLNEKQLEKPKKGKKVSKEEYDEIVAKKTKEMGVDGGNGTQVIMKMEYSTGN